MRGKIFISYRRDDSAPHALNVAQYFEKTFGKRNVFIDVDHIKSGENFPEILKQRLDASAVMLAVMGPGWAEARDQAGNRRLDDPADWVRLEIQDALARKIKVIPVLVGGATTVPAASILPEPLKPLATLQAAVITTNGVRYELAGLAADVRAIVGRDWLKLSLAAAAAVVLLAVGALAYRAGQVPGADIGAVGFEATLTAACRSELETWRQSAAVGAFAIGGNRACGSSRGQPQVAAARKAALDACAKAGGECRIVELIEGDWTINTACQVQQRFFKSEPAVKAFAVSRSGHCASAVGKRDAETARTEALTECERIAGNCRVIEIDLGNWQLGEACTKRLEEWRKKPTARAFAVSRHGACGWSDSESSQSDARRTALAECANRGADCKVIEVSEGNWEIETDCKETYDKWTRLRGRGSFAVGRNGGCGYTYGYGSTSEADSEALRHCRESDGVECKVIGRR